MGIFAWVGDSELLHARYNASAAKWEQVFKSDAHRCDIDQEWQQQAKSKEGLICDHRGENKWYACKGRSCIGTTRALGDSSLNDIGLVMRQPQVMELDLQPGDLLIVASDGLWDMVDPPAILSRLNNGERDPKKCDISSNWVHALGIEAKGLWDSTEHNDDVSIVTWCVPSDWTTGSPQNLDDLVFKYQLTPKPRRTYDRLPSNEWEKLALYARERFTKLRRAETAKFNLHGITMAALLHKGSVGELCQRLDSPKKSLTRRLTHMFHSDYTSTCGKVHVSHVFEQTAVVQMKCYMDSGDYPDIGDFGRCAISRSKSCHGSLSKNGGCRPGTSCRVDFQQLLSNGRGFPGDVEWFPRHCLIDS
eukprot:TRINITY_DN81934_c0_g1_i1.p1 TRINITY_DN81934_c0_g1~~TRINITY_DN81934_c0_g1_i1.p1  ORF type:complete len:399 (-),score=46.89 TRINITY_DN81934_c0_g1_i1:29-1114(-)